MSGFSDRRIILVKNFTIMEDKVDILLKFIPKLIPEIMLNQYMYLCVFILFVTYIPSFNFFRIVEISIGIRIIFLQVGNCFVLTGVRKGQQSSWPPSSDKSVWQIDKSLSILDVLEFFFLLFFKVSGRLSSKREVSIDGVNGNS